MPKKLTKKITVEDKIIAHLKAKGQKMNWLAGEIGVSPGHLQLVLKGSVNKATGILDKRPLTTRNLNTINQILGTNF